MRSSVRLWDSDHLACGSVHENSNSAHESSRTVSAEQERLPSISELIPNIEKFYMPETLTPGNYFRANAETHPPTPQHRMQPQQQQQQQQKQQQHPLNFKRPRFEIEALLAEEAQKKCKISDLYQQLNIRFSPPMVPGIPLLHRGVNTITQLLPQTLAGPSLVIGMPVHTTKIIPAVPTDDLALLLAAAEKVEAASSSSPAFDMQTLSSGIQVSPVRSQSSASTNLQRTKSKTPLSFSGERKHKCAWESCTMAFPTSSELTCHIRTHTGEKPYKCEFAGCGKAFAQSGGLVRHRRTHTGDKPYKCQYPNCTKAFAESGHLTRHHRSHTGERPYPCTFLCGKSFATSYHLLRHMKVHTSHKVHHDKSDDQTPNLLDADDDDDFDSDFDDDNNDNNDNNSDTNDVCICGDDDDDDDKFDHNQHSPPANSLNNSLPQSQKTGVKKEECQ